MSKKGSLEMSMNSIVVIILAVIFVVTVIAFFQTIFAEQQENVLSVIDSFPNVNPPTSSEPFKIPKDEIELESGELRKLEAYYLYRGVESANCVLAEGDNAGSNVVEFIIPPVPAQLNDGDKVKLDFQVQAGDVNDNAFGITPIQICCSASGSPLTNGVCADGTVKSSIDISYNVKP